MRRSGIVAIGAVGLVVVLGAAGAVLRRGGALPTLYWNSATGELRAADGGLHLLPRWHWSRLPAGPLEVRFDTITADGVTVPLHLAWRPDTGSYDLGPDPSHESSGGAAPAGAAAALAARLVEIRGDLLAGSSALCLAAADTDCADRARRQASERLARRLGTAPADLDLRFDLAAVRSRAATLAPLAARLTPPAGPVLLLGLDGLDWDLVLPWVEEGRLPHLQRLLALGTWGRMETLRPLLSPLIWTTVATGVSPEHHGILDFVERDPATGTLRPVTSSSRRVPAIWDLASAFGRRVDVVGWWGTWPAPPVAGTLVSDRLFYSLGAAATQRPEEGLVFPRASAPAFLERRRAAEEAFDYERFREFAAVDAGAFEAAVAAGRGLEDRIDGLRHILAATDTYLGSGLALATEDPADLLMVYLEGTDTIGHLLAATLPPPRLSGLAPGEPELWAAAVRRYFEHVDSWLGRYLEACPPEHWTWILVSDHGFFWGEDRPHDLVSGGGLGAAEGATAALWHGEDASYLVAGAAAARRGRVDGAASVYDVAPSLAALLGLPRDENWRGRPLPGLTADPRLPGVDLTGLLPRSPATTPVAGETAVEDAALARLAALGYLDAGRPATDVGEELRAEPTDRELNNLALLQQGEGRLEEAAATLRRAIELYPDEPYPYVNLSRVLFDLRRFDEADDTLFQGLRHWGSLEGAWESSAPVVLGASRAYREAGRAERELALLRRATNLLPDDARLWQELLTVRSRSHDCGPGLVESREAAARFPDHARIQGLHGLMALCAGDAAEARRGLERSLALQPGQAVLENALRALR